MSDATLQQVFALDPEASRCPYPAYAAARAEAPVTWADRVNAWVVTRYADIVEVLHQPELFSSAAASGPGGATSVAKRVAEDPATPPDLRRMAERRVRINSSPVLILADPPLHWRQRNLVNRAFTPRRVAAMEESMRTIATGIVAAYPDDAPIEIMSQLASPLPMSVIADLLGIPRSGMARFKRWSDAFVVAVGNVNLTDAEVAEMLTAMDEFYDYFSEQIADRQARPTEDMLSTIVHARLDGVEPLSHDEMLGMLVLFLVAGNETTTNAIGWTVLHLLQRPEELARLRADRSLVPAFVEEVLRFDAPVQGLFRTATQNTEVGGVPIAAGEHLWLVYGSANHDPAAFETPEDLCPGRTVKSNHLTFGLGEHFCLGASLARAETRVAVEALLDRFEHLRVVEPVPPCHRNFVIHGLTALHVDPRPA
jgi:cytochrome P450